MSSSINKSDFTDIGELVETEEGGLTINLLFGKMLKRVTKHMIGKKLEVSFRPLEYQRSQAQNRYLWGVAYVTISAWYRETQGERISKDAIHAHTVSEILGRVVEVEEVFGKEVLVVKGKSTSQLTKKEFNDLVEKLQKYWGDKGCDIPLPREHNYISDFIDETEA